MLKIVTLSVAILAWPIASTMVETVDASFTKSVTFHVTPDLISTKTATAKQIAGADTTTLKQSGWYSAAIKKLMQQEYEFKPAADGSGYFTPNRRNNLQFTYSDKGFTVKPRTTKIPVGKIDAVTRPDEIKYTTLPDWKIAFHLKREQIGNGVWQVAENKAVYTTDNITVQYINNEDGMRQNFIVKSATATGDNEKIYFNIETALKVQVQNNRLQFANKQGVVMDYDQLKVWDANGQPLEATFEKSNRDYCIHVQSNKAVYPITIDPLSSTPAAILEANQADAHVGFSVASAGDVNGDGYSDVIVGAVQYDNGETDEGAAFIYHGSSTGINATAAAMVESNQASAFMGGAVASAGDVNGDGYSDVIVGAYAYDNGQADEGAAFIYHGSPTGINTTAAAIIESNQAGAYLGYSVSSTGDVNGDGYSDVIAGAYQYDNGQTDEGAVFIYHGSASGINTTAVATVEGNQGNGYFGGSVASAGDVNGDGYSDVIVGAKLYDNGQTDEGAAFIYHGSPTGINPTAAAMVESNQANAFMGGAVACAGDVNGDGYSDVIAGAYTYDNGQTDEGAAFIYHGSATGINTTAAAMVESNQANANLGGAVACAGDVNGDGYSDVIAGAYAYDNGQTDEGAAFIYNGSPTGITIAAPVMVESNQAGANLGYSVSSAGDVNGDGYSDVITGAPYYTNGETNEGAAFIYHGSAAGINPTQATLVESNQGNGYLGYSVAGAGDVNGDGYSDVIVGAYSYDNGQADEGAAFIYHGSATGISTTAAAMVEGNQAAAYFGYAVGGAGDVNGDGYYDVIVGAEGYSNGQYAEGAAFIYHGSATGISITPAVIVESNQVSAYSGFSVAGAGDVNGDGYSDVIVGAYLYDNGQTNEGAAFIYHGSATGISTTAAVRLESNQVEARFGTWVATAGDVNGDGYSDVIVGAYQYDNGETDEGADFIYHGSATGISTTAAAMVESNKAGAYMGTSATGGDINGDGYSDVIVGASYYNNGQALEGALFICYGSATGINAAAATRIESNKVQAYMGWSVSAGDVNGDGYMDVIAGAPIYSNGQSMEGAVYVYNGAASGINTTPSAIVEYNLASAFFGFSVACAGDVNGDGYSDMIVGADQYNNGQTNEGAFFIYYGNQPGSGIHNNLDLYNTDLTTRIARSNITYGSFGAGLFAKSFLGRTKGKLVWEIEPSYNAYSGTPITNSVLFTSAQGSFTDLGLTGTELKNLVSKVLGSRYTKVRARVKYDAVTALTGQVYGPWRYMPELALGLSLGALPVDLISFKAEWLEKGRTAQIKFVTDNETDICCYEIEKSSDGVTFYTIGKLSGKNTGTRNNYSYTDNNARAIKQYYRLKIIFQSGTIEYSNLQWLQSNAAIEVIVFPNPATNVLQLRLNNTYSTMQGQIMNAAGQTLKQLNNLSTAGQIVSIPISDLAAGTYFLYLQSGDEKQVLQFVKQ